jgi:hypothetical protein
MIDFPPRDSPAWYDWSERAAIREFEGGYSRAEAERLAREDLCKREKTGEILPQESS